MTFQCLCGFSLQLTGSKELVDGVLGVLMPMHQGDGHGATDPRTAYKARKKAEQASTRQEHHDDA